MLNTKALLVASKEVGLEVNVEKIKCKFMSWPEYDTILQHKDM
jgi:hypothetical protein